VLSPNSPLSRKFIARRQRAGFSLVEVVLAVGVISFAFVAILGLLPAGLQQFRQAMDNSVGAQIAQRIIQDCQLTDFATLTGGVTTDQPFQVKTYNQSRSAQIPFRYFDEQGNEVVIAGTTPSPKEAADIVYHVNTRMIASTTLPGGLENAGVCSVLVQVVFNPSGRTLPLTSSYLIDTTKLPGVAIKNYSAQVGRND
jgi:uncharacterized protein (TIGR02598 family)